jgi:CMP-N,N'-diacetyllegionaminic acid synthase
LKALIVGFGSIGKRHFEILSALDCIDSVHIVTKQSFDDIVSFREIVDIEDLECYDYFVIASETSKHYEQLKYICSCVNEKNILVEKPLYDKRYEDIKSDNKIFTAYNLRFHPVLQKLKILLRDKQVYYANIICGQYLPTWRPEQNYRESYSADISRGGGVLRDLSHELDYIGWIFGDFEKIDYINAKVSDLEINSDDIFTAIAVTKNKSIINVTMDYISKAPMRQMVVHTKEYTIIADMIKNTIIIVDKELKEETIEFQKLDRNYTYTKMHKSILNEDCEDVCDFSAGQKIVDLIDSIELKDISSEKV